MDPSSSSIGTSNNISGSGGSSSNNSNNSNSQLCRICISSNSHSNRNAPSSAQQMISIFGEDALWRKITTLADVKIERGDTLPQQVCVACAKNAISACLFKKKCEDADNFFRQQLLIQKFEGKAVGAGVQDVITLSEGEGEVEEEDADAEELQHRHQMQQQQHHHQHRQRLQQQQQQQRQRNAHNASSDVDAEEGAVDDDDDEEEEEDEDEQEEDHEQHHHHRGHGHVPAHHHVADDGEIIKSANGKQQQPPFDFNSIRLMHEYMQQQLSKINGGGSGGGGGGGPASHSDAAGDDDEPLPLIPEIELITPSEDMSGGACGNVIGLCGPATGAEAPLRGYQCPTCFQIFEMKQILKAHMQSVHGTAGPVYECANCKKTYFYKRFLEKHVRRGRCVKKRRNQTRPMQCSDCHVLFPTGHHLGWHKRTGCPSRAAKMPLQQLFKQNIVQYNNFPKRIGIRKPENAIYLHNRKLIMANNKRKGRTRIKLDAKKIALAKQLILREATTTVIANELNISRTFAWRLRKSLVNGVSLHERVIDPNASGSVAGNGEELPPQPMLEMMHAASAATVEHIAERFQHAQTTIKAEKLESDMEGDEEVPEEAEDEDEAIEEDEGEEGDQDEDEDEQNHSMQQRNEQIRTEQHHQQQQQRHTQKHHQQQQQQRLYAPEMTITPVRSSASLAEERAERARHHAAAAEDEEEDDDDHDVDDDDNEEAEIDGAAHQQNTLETDHYVQQSQQRADGSVIRIKRDLDFQKSTVSSAAAAAAAACALNGNLQSMPLLSQFPPAVAAAIHQLPVNLSIRPIASMRHSATSPPPLHHHHQHSHNNNSNHSNNNNNHNNNSTSSNSEAGKKPRKPNVFIDDEKYAMAKMLVAQNSSTMEIARALNVSQMTAWKVRDAIVKGVPLSYRSKRDMRDTVAAAAASTMLKQSMGGGREATSAGLAAAEANEQQLQAQQQQQQQQYQQQQLQMLQRQQQMQQQQQQQQQQMQSQHQQTAANVGAAKMINPRRRLKAAERELRDKEITREILELIKEDSNIQYWKVSARLAEKGYPISPSSVCQKLKSMGIHRRWKPGDKPPMLDMEQLKVASGMAAAVAASVGGGGGSSAEDDAAAVVGGYEQQFDMGGAHFLSAFTR